MTGPAESGVYSSGEATADARLSVTIGLNRSLVKSKISDPIAPIAVAYLSRRTRDSLTMKSAKRRTRSASVVAAASWEANAWNRSTAPAANCSALCVMTRCFDIGVVADIGGLEFSLAFILEADLVCGGGVGSAFGAIDEPPALFEGFVMYGEAPVSSLGSLAELLFRGVTLASVCPLDSPGCCDGRVAELLGTTMSAIA